MEETTPPLEGALFVLAGEFGGEARARWTRALEARGAQVRASVSNQTRYLVLGQNPGPRTLEKARARGVRTLTEAQLEALLEGRGLPSPAPRAPGAALNAALSSLRALAHSPPTPRAWEALCAQLEEHPPEGVALALEYVRPLLERWEAPAEEVTQGAAMPLGELRLAPERWITEACAGRATPLLSLCRGLRYAGKGINGRVGQALLEAPSLEGLRALDLSNNPLSKGFVEALSRAGLPSLRRLSLQGVACGPRGFKALASGPTTARLTHLDLSLANLGEGLGGADGPLRAASWPEIEWLSLSRNAGFALRHLGEVAAEKRLKYLDISGTYVGYLEIDWLLRSEGLRGVEQLGLEQVGLSGEALGALLRGRWEGPLRGLQVGLNRLGLEGAEYVANAASLEGLRALGLFDAELGEAGALALARRRSWGELRALELGLNEIGSRGGAALLEAPWSAGLRSLGLSNNPLGGPFVAALKAATWLRLESLELDHTQITGLQALELLKAPHIQRLRWLTLPVWGYKPAVLEAMLRHAWLPEELARRCRLLLRR